MFTFIIPSCRHLAAIVSSKNAPCSTTTPALFRRYYRSNLTATWAIKVNIIISSLLRLRRASLRWIVMIASFCFSCQALAWNALGHQIIAQIAYDNMTNKAKRLSNSYNQALDVVYAPQTFVSAAPWLDALYYKQGVPWFRRLHFVNWKFSKEGAKFANCEPMNAIWAIEQALEVISNTQSSPFDKGLALRIVIHVVGDIHQPLHATSLVSASHPKGDQGGNLFPLKKTAIAKNLHTYWDNGGGFLKKKGEKKLSLIKNMAHALEKEWPCHWKREERNLKLWAKQSHQLGIRVAYQIKPNTKPSKAYQLRAQKVVKKQLAIAGCRLAAVLNTVNQKRNTTDGSYH
jgi:S1/P1 Nuclease